MYTPPVAEITHILRHVAGFDAALETGRFGDLSIDLLDAVLEEAGRLASSEIEPMAVAAEKTGAIFKDGKVTMPAGWREAYQAFCEGGWNGVSGPEEFGGQGLPQAVWMATLELWNSCSVAFGLCPTLTTGAIEAIDKHASHDLKSRYLPKMISGEWTGSMNLTEPQAGSDLAAIRTRAERAGDGSYRIFGQKIFITFGEHDLTGNIVHLVLARLSDAPAGTKGISLFLVPKYLPDADGNPGKRNDAYAVSIEHKLGIHASPTCVMVYGDGKSPDVEAGAVGYLVGEENRGLACMFTMMNNARLAVGVQGVALCEGATQKAIAFAKDRRQGRSSSGSAGQMSPIIEHPDVARMLMTMKANTQAARAICLACAVAIDRANTSEGEEQQFWSDRAAFLTPLAKAFSTDAAMEVASLGIQVHGGMGFIEETGAARFLRDARIPPIYEGTNGIQAIDLVMRKLPLGNGVHAQGYVDELSETVNAISGDAFGSTAARLKSALDDVLAATLWLQREVAEGRADNALAGATPYQRLVSLAAGGVYLAKSALVDEDMGRIAMARFFAENILGETAVLRDRVVNGADSLFKSAKLALA